MIEIATKAKTEAGSRLWQWLFNPFKFVAGYKALLSGLAVILISAFIASFSNTDFDGVLDVRMGLEAPLWCFFAEGLINWICVAAPLFFFGLIVSRSSFRAIDVFGTQALARGPYLIAAVVMLPDANRRFGEYLTAKFTQAAPTVGINYYRCAHIRIYSHPDYSDGGLDGRVDVQGLCGVLQYKRCKGHHNLHCEFDRCRSIV